MYGKNMTNLDPNISSSIRTVFASCRHPQKHCPLYDALRWRQNAHVTKSFTPDHLFVCSIALRGTATEITNEMPAIIAICEQVCTTCNMTKKQHKHR